MDKQLKIVVNLTILYFKTKYYPFQEKQSIINVLRVYKMVKKYKQHYQCSNYNVLFLELMMRTKYFKMISSHKN